MAKFHYEYDESLILDFHDDSVVAHPISPKALLGP